MTHALSLVHLRGFGPVLVLAVLTLFAACVPPAEEEPMTFAPDVEERLATFAPTVIEADLSGLSESERQVLDKLIAAAGHMNEIFKLQAWPEHAAFRERLAAQSGPQAKAALAFFDIMYGPWDRQNHREAFVGYPAEPAEGGDAHAEPTDEPQAAAEPAPAVNMRDWPRGAGYYPEDLTADELDAYLEAHPDQADALLSLYTVVREDESGEGLVAVPYSEVYAEHLEAAAGLLREAAAITDNESLKLFLEQRAEAFLTDDYYESEKAWMDLDSPIEVTIGPYEVYEDELKATKAAFESFVTVTDPAASEALAKYKSLLPSMEDNLPIPDELKTERGAESPIRVVDVVYTGGDTRAGVQTIAFNLPNDERIRAEKGSKKVLLRNAMMAKFDAILTPLAGEVLDASQLEHLSGEAFFNQTLFHELSHGLGPAYVTGKEGLEVRQALEDTYSSLEEGKADVMGAYNILYMIDRGEMPESFRKQLLATYFAGLFRSVRFGTGEAHGQGAAIQLNWFLKERAVTLGDDGKFTVGFDKLEASIRGLVRELCLLQASGDKARAETMLDDMGRIYHPVRQALERLTALPVDIKPVYTAAGETL